MNAADTPFRKFFEVATGRRSYQFQDRFAQCDPTPQLLDVPTGLGKTATVIISWLWKRSLSSSTPVPRRLVYCLPMRTLVTQTAEAAMQWTRNLLEAHQIEEPCRVHVLMGGEPKDDWDLYPEKDAIIIGTQDMLLSRLLNRGYGMSRYRWPMHFGLLSNDCLWVMDEVQLMGSGLATTVQVDAFQRRLWKPLIPCHFLWMSATLGDSLLRTKDREDLDLDDIDPNSVFSLEKAEKAEPAVHQRLTAEKQIEVLKKPPQLQKKDGSGIFDQHQAGRISLFILNTVPVAQDWYGQIKSTLTMETKGKEKAPPMLVLLHSRFRPPDRQRHMEKLQGFLDRQDGESGAVPNDPGLFLVSTQVIEAGIDISSIRLWSEVAPWPSDVQRLGRLNREGKQDGATAAFWMPGNTEDNNKGAPNESKQKQQRIGPYFKRDLETARKLLQSVKDRMNQGENPCLYRQALDAVLGTRESRRALEIEYEAVIRPHDFFELFATEPDLAGGFTDVSRFVRDQDRNVDAYVFWRESQVPAGSEPAPAADELCPVPYYSVQQFFGKKGVAREWDAELGQWNIRRASDVRPGMTLRLWQKQGGYDPDLGWTGNHADIPTVDLPVTASNPDTLHADDASESHDWLSLTDHTADVEAEMNELVRAFELSGTPEGIALTEVAPWHDIGKASDSWKRAIKRYLELLLPKVQDCLREENDPYIKNLLKQFASMLVMPGDDCWAKFPDIKWLLHSPDLPAERKKGLRRSLYTPFQSGYRHEAASALVAWKTWQDGTTRSLSGLAVYLIAAHHGKVRTVLRSIRGTDEVFGISEGDELLPVNGILPVKTIVSTEPRRFGASGRWNDEGGMFLLESTSWVSLVVNSLGTAPVDLKTTETDSADALGPFKLAFLETLFRVADGRASAHPRKGQNP